MSCPHRSYTSDPFIYLDPFVYLCEHCRCILTVRHILVECNHFARERKDKPVLLQAVREVVLCRARIGHTHLTHSYILRKDPPPLCEHCRCILTVLNILVECNHFARERKDIFCRRDVMESFIFYPTPIVLFLKQIQFYYKF